MPDHVIGEEKSSQRVFHFIVKNRFAKKHLIAMRPQNAGNTNLFKIGIQFTACPAITIDNGNVTLVTQVTLYLTAYHPKTQRASLPLVLLLVLLL